MSTIQAARQVLVRAESELRRLLKQATDEELYSDVGEILELLKNLAKLSGRSALTTAPGSSRVESGNSYPSGPSMPILPSAREKGAFPRFERESDKLVKIGWSKKNKSTYEHRASRAAVFSIAHYLMASVPEGKIFTMDEILPVPDAANGDDEIPSYQVYMTMAWLRDAHAIAKKGRDRYAVSHETYADSALERLWATLPQYALSPRGLRGTE